MATFTKAHLSGAADGLAIKIAATATAGTLIHTCVAGTTTGSFSEVWIWLVNSSASACKVTIEWGEATAPDGNIEVTVPAEEGLMQAIPGLIMHNGKEIRAFAAVADVVMAHGFANEIA